MAADVIFHTRTSEPTSIRGRRKHSFTYVALVWVGHDSHTQTIHWTAVYTRSDHGNKNLPPVDIIEKYAKQINRATVSWFTGRQIIICEYAHFFWFRFHAITWICIFESVYWTCKTEMKIKCLYVTMIKCDIATGIGIYDNMCEPMYVVLSWCKCIVLTIG